jgi:glycosyltransferase involved in cell wall biosynthesis
MTARASSRVPVLKRRLQPIADPLLVSAALRRRNDLRAYHAIEYGQPLWTSAPVVVTVHDFIPFLCGRPYRWMRRERLLGLRLLRRADALIAVSHSTARDAIRIGGVDPARITVIPSGVHEGFQPAKVDDITAFRGRIGLSPRDQYLLAVGTFDPHKRLDMLVAVAKRVREEYPLGLVIVGDQGPYAQQILKTVKAASLSDATALAGFVTDAELVAAYSGAHCLVVTSAYEGFGLPVLEAMACHTPVVAFNNSSLPEVCGDAGLLVPDGDDQAMASAVIRLLSDEDELSRRLLAGALWAREFTWERSARAHLEVYDRVGA